jgi:hypothetical protein
MSLEHLSQGSHQLAVVCMCVLGGGLAHNSYSELCLFSNSCYLIFVFILLLWLTSWNHWRDILGP